MMLEFERFLAYLFTPFPIILILLLIGLVLLFFDKRLKLAKIFLLIASVMIIFFTCFKIPQTIRKNYEERFKPYNTIISDIRNDIANTGRKVEWIVVLAGGVATDKDLSIVSNLSNATLKRLSEGMILYRKFKGSKLLLSGGNPPDSPIKEADLMKQFCVLLGIPRKDIIIERSSLETYEQAINIKKIIGNKKFILVSSALHFPRAENMFRTVGLNPIILPTDLKPKTEYKWYDYLPDEGGITEAKKLLVSFWAYLGAWLKGQI